MIVLFTDNNSKKDIIGIIRKNILHPREELVITGDDLTNTDILARARIGICSDSDPYALSLLCESQTPVITCGMSSHNTVTLSSRTDTDCSVTLQRAVKRIDGKSTEPAEYPIILTSAHQPFTVMAASAIMLLNGATPEKL